jgi:hypothetical protein
VVMAAHVCGAACPGRLGAVLECAGGVRRKTACLWGVRVRTSAGQSCSSHCSRNATGSPVWAAWRRVFVGVCVCVCSRAACPLPVIYGQVL